MIKILVKNINLQISYQARDVGHPTPRFQIYGQKIFVFFLVF